MSLGRSHRLCSARLLGSTVFLSGSRGRSQAADWYSDQIRSDQIRRSSRAELVHGPKFGCLLHGGTLNSPRSVGLGNDMDLCMLPSNMTSIFLKMSNLRGYPSYWKDLCIYLTGQHSTQTVKQEEKGHPFNFCLTYTELKCPPPPPQISFRKNKMVAVYFNPR